jgi:hypothetical protein
MGQSIEYCRSLGMAVIYQLAITHFGNIHDMCLNQGDTGITEPECEAQWNQFLHGDPSMGQPNPCPM